MQAQVKSILEALIAAGFDDGRVTITETDVNELNISHNHVSLMRTTQSQSLSLMGIRDKRRVSTSLSSLEDSAVQQAITDLQRDVATSPQDEAYAVAPNQMGSFSKGPQSVDREAMAACAKSFLEYRSEQYPTFQIEESAIKHTLEKTTLLTSQDTELSSIVGSYEIMLMGSSKDEHGSSSFNYTGGTLDELPAQVADVFDIDVLMANSVQETKTELVGDKFEGDVILTPMAVMDLIGWLSGQVSDFALLSNRSVYQDSVGEAIASPLLTLTNYPDGSGEAPFNDEGFVIEPMTLIDQGKLTCLLPSFYGSRKLDIPHTPVGSSWSIGAGETNRADMQQSIERGALVGRLSMGSPAPNGDFSGVIKNSFLLENGERSKALSETMITGNVAQMLKDIVAVSSEVSDFGGFQVPWLKVRGLRFS